MNTELATDFFLQRLVTGGDMDRAFIEIGLGSGDWSFSWAASRGFRCVAVEPAPVDSLRDACKKAKVELIKAAVGRDFGRVLLYCGEVGGQDIPDTSSLKRNWWAAGARTLEVEVITVSMMLARAGVSGMACMKVDVEGAEADVLAGLRSLPETARPEVVTFEYGGGGVKGCGKGGWSDEGWQNTLECLQILSECGYTAGLLCERRLAVPKVFDIAQAAAHPDDVFPTGAEVGNVVALRGAVTPNWENWILDFLRIDRRNQRQEKWRAWGAKLMFQIRRYRNAIARRLSFRQ